MKRSVLVVVLTATLLTFRLVPGSAQAERAGQSSTINPTPSPSPTLTVVPTPKTREIWRLSARMTHHLSQVHSEGVWTDGFGNRPGHALNLLSDCDSKAHKARFNIEGLDSDGALLQAQFIFGPTLSWSRHRKNQEAWTQWEELGLDVLRFSAIIAQICPMKWLSNVKPIPPRLRNAGVKTVDGFTVWELRSSVKKEDETVRTRVDIDQTSLVWRRFVTLEIYPKKVDSVIFDTHYSKFNEPVDITVPPTSSSRNPSGSGGWQKTNSRLRSFKLHHRRSRTNDALRTPATSVRSVLTLP
jgi:hypothetical protein